MLNKEELKAFIEKLQGIVNNMQTDHKVCTDCWDIIIPWQDKAGRLRYSCYCTLD